MPGDEPTLRERLEAEVPRATCDDLPESTLDAVMVVVAPELERRDEQIAELEAEVERLAHLTDASSEEALHRCVERDEARAEVERLREAMRDMRSSARIVVAELEEQGYVPGDDAYQHASRILARTARASSVQPPSGNTETGTEATDAA